MGASLPLRATAPLFVYETARSVPQRARVGSFRTESISKILANISFKIEV
jgi:hypothetical protein